MKTYLRQLRALGACQSALDWAESSSHATLTDAWAHCPRGDWMLWLMAKGTPPAQGSEEHRKLTRLAVSIARQALPLFEAKHPGDSRVRECLDITERWCDGLATIEEVRKARADAAYAAYAADAAAYADAAAADAAAAYAAAYAAADAAAAAADAAAYADAYAAYAAYAAAADAVRAKSLAQCADMVRLAYPQPPQL